MQRTIRVDHVKDYRPPDQDDKNVDDVTKIVRAEGIAPRPLTPSASEDDDLIPLEDGWFQFDNKSSYGVDRCVRPSVKI